MAYDSTRQRTVLFGGTYSGTPLGDTWAWDGNSWLPEILVAGPSPRYGHAMAFDNVRQQVVLFGGTTTFGTTSLGDTWEWDGSNWSQKSSTGPVSRFDHAMAFHEQGACTVLFGGRNANGALGDTWRWDGTDWTQASSPGPSPRYSHAMTLDKSRGVAVLFGGFANTGGSDTWEWDGATWSLASAVGPTVFAHSMVFDPERDVVMILQGSSAWEWDGASWAQASLTLPPSRFEAAMTYDAQRSQVVLFGGAMGQLPLGLGIPLGDTWTLNSGTSSGAYVFGAGCGNPALSLTPDSTAPPIIDTTARATLANIPSSLSFVSLGWSRAALGPFPLPLTLIGYGMPGCAILQSSEAAAQPTSPTAPGRATYGLSLPNWSGLIGLHVYLQAWAAAPGYNTAGVVVSNGLDWVVGNS